MEFEVKKTTSEIMVITINSNTDESQPFDISTTNSDHFNKLIGTLVEIISCPIIEITLH